MRPHHAGAGTWHVSGPHWDSSVIWDGWILMLPGVFVAAVLATAYSTFPYLLLMSLVVGLGAYAAALLVQWAQAPMPVAFAAAHLVAARQSSKAPGNGVSGGRR